MDNAMNEAIGRKPVGNVGIAFLKFCAVHDQPALSKEANDHVIYLNAAYPGVAHV
jgi:hypothetical protein